MFTSWLDWLVASSRGLPVSSFFTPKFSARYRCLPPCIAFCMWILGIQIWVFAIYQCQPNISRYCLIFPRGSKYHPLEPSVLVGTIFLSSWVMPFYYPQIQPQGKLIHAHPTLPQGILQATVLFTVKNHIAHLSCEGCFIRLCPFLHWRMSSPRQGPHRATLFWFTELRTQPAESRES